MNFTGEQSRQIILEREQAVRDYWHTSTPASIRVKIWLRTRWYALCRVWYVLKLSSHSFVGHIGILLSKSSSEFDYGLMVEEAPSGVLCWNRRTCARVRGIRELTALYCWASSIEEQIFLSGFDKGEEFALRLVDMPLEEIPASTWVDPTESGRKSHQ